MKHLCIYREYKFSSSHRLHAPDLSDKENIAVYDKCNNYNGHGHDYTLEVGVKGKPDAKTGMIIDLQEMDGLVNKLLKKFDYYNLDHEVEFFKHMVSTGENIIRVIWNELDKLFGHDRLYYLKLWETNNNYFEYCRDYPGYND